MRKRKKKKMKQKTKKQKTMKNQNSAEIERCGICGQPCTPAIYRQKQGGTNEPLCHSCAEKWLESEEDWPTNSKTEVAESRQTH